MGVVRGHITPEICKTGEKWIINGHWDHIGGYRD